MRNKHVFEVKISCKCPYRDCGRIFDKKIEIEYVTNQRGDVIEHRILN